MSPESPSGKSPQQRAASSVTISADRKIYTAIFNAVMDHRLPPGTKLPEASLSLYFGISRTVVRKALAQLAHEGIIWLRPNRSAVVAAPSVQETQQVFEARRIVETAITRAVVRDASKHQLAELHGLVKSERDAYERGDFRTLLRRSGSFHLRLAEIAGNSVLTQFLSQLVSRTSLIIALYEAPGKSPCSFEEHLLLTKAIEQGEEDQAVELMHKHLGTCQNKLNLTSDEKPIDLAEVFGEMS